MLKPVREKAAALGSRLAARVAEFANGAKLRLDSALEVEEPAAPEPPPKPEPGRIHITEKPQLLGLQGWWEVALKIWEELGRDRLFLVAAGVAFFTLLAIFPALSALVAIWSLFGDPKWVADSIGEIAFVLPPGSADIVRSQAELVASGGRRDLSFYIAGTFLISVWSANSGMKSMFDAMNLIYQEDEKRSFLALNLRSLLFTLGSFAIFLATVALLVAAPIFFKWVNLEERTMEIFSLSRWPALFVITVTFLTLLNRYGPSRSRERARWSVWGSTLGAFMWLAVSVIFSFYVGHIGNLAATYGSLAAIAGLMTWLWLSALVILIGIELNAELEHRTDQWEAERQRRLQAPKVVKRRDWRGALERWRKR